jgi:hypothetical protein
VSLRRAPDESRFAQRAPADTLLFVSGADLYGSFIKGTLESMDRAMRDWGPGAVEVRETIDGLNREIGIDLEADLLGQLSGEYAVAAGARSADLDSAWLLAMTAVKDGATVGRALTKLEDYARRQGEPVSATNSGAATITRVGRDGTADSLAYALAGNDLIAGMDVSSVQQAVSVSGGLSGDAEYREALRALPSGRSLTVFVNISRALQRIPEMVDQLGWTQAMNLRSLALGFTQDGDRVGGVAFLRVGGE